MLEQSEAVVAEKKSRTSLRLVVGAGVGKQVVLSDEERELFRLLVERNLNPSHVGRTVDLFTDEAFLELPFFRNTEAFQKALRRIRGVLEENFNRAK